MTTMRRTLLALTAAVSLAATLTACGGEDPGATTPVASLPATASGSAGAGAGGPSAPGGGTDTDASGRPVLRLDDSDDRRFALWNAHTQCLLEHGAVESSDGMGIDTSKRGGGRVIPTLERPVPKAATAACVSIEPVGPLELEASTNPDFHDQSLAYVDCLREHGEYVRLLNDHNIDWTYVEGHPVPDNQAVFEEQCLLDAFGGK